MKKIIKLLLKTPAGRLIAVALLTDFKTHLLEKAEKGNYSPQKKLIVSEFLSEMTDEITNDFINTK